MVDTTKATTEVMQRRIMEILTKLNDYSRTTMPNGSVAKRSITSRSEEHVLRRELIRLRDALEDKEAA